ncbi:MAG: hypothetical protein ACRDJH_11045 [Thermomicrobiales bacterium]
MAVEVAIGDDDELLRRLAPDHVTKGAVNSLAFSGRSHEANEISVDLRRLTTEERTLASRPSFGLGVLQVGDVRAMGLEIVHDPVEGNDAHCLIVGEYSKAVTRYLAKLTRVVKAPHPRSG